MPQKDEDGGLNLQDNFLTAENAGDLVSEDAKLYDNKDINLEAPKIKENIDLLTAENAGDPIQELKTKVVIIII